MTVPPRAPDPADSVIALEMIGNVGGDPARLLSTTQTNVLGAFDAHVSPGLRFTDGKAPHAYVYEWTRPDQTRRLARPAERPRGVRGVGAATARARRGLHGRFAVEIGKQRLEADIDPTEKDTAPRDVKLGVVKPPAGAAMFAWCR